VGRLFARYLFLSFPDEKCKNGKAKKGKEKVKSEILDKNIILYLYTEMPWVTKITFLSLHTAMPWVQLKNK
jgi:hypothetical protein